MHVWNHGNPPPPPPQEDEGYNFIGPWGTLNFYLPLGVLTQMGGLKSFTLFFGRGGNKVFWGDGGAPPPLAKNLLISLPPGKVPQ